VTTPKWAFSPIARNHTVSPLWSGFQPTGEPTGFQPVEPQFIRGIRRRKSFCSNDLKMGDAELEPATPSVSKRTTRPFDPSGSP
jgi:hypothetical protein